MEGLRPAHEALGRRLLRVLVKEADMNRTMRLGRFSLGVAALCLAAAGYLPAQEKPGSAPPASDLKPKTPVPLIRPKAARPGSDAVPTPKPAAPAPVDESAEEAPNAPPKPVAVLDSHTRIMGLDARTMKKLPPEAVISYKKGLSALDHISYEEALDHFEAASKASPDTVDLHFMIIKLATFRGQTTLYLEAEKFYDQGLRHVDAVLKMPKATGPEKARAEFEHERLAKEKAALAQTYEARVSYGHKVATEYAKQIYTSRSESKEIKAYKEALKALTKSPTDATSKKSAAAAAAELATTLTGPKGGGPAAPKGLSTGSPAVPGGAAAPGSANPAGGATPAGASNPPGAGSSVSGGAAPAGGVSLSGAATPAGAITAPAGAAASPAPSSAAGSPNSGDASAKPAAGAAGLNGASVAALDKSSKSMDAMPKPASGAVSPDVQQALQDLQKAASATKTMTADYEMNLKMTGMPPTSMKGTMAQKEAMTRMAIEMSMNGKPTHNLYVNDKDGILWNEREIGTTKNVVKTDTKAIVAAKKGGAELNVGPLSGAAGPNSPLNTAAQMEKTLKDMTLKGSDKLDGVDVVTIDGMLNPDAAGNVVPGAKIEKASFTFGKADGIMRQMKLASADGASEISMAFKNVKTNPPIDDAQFVYTPPAGAKVTDITADTVKAIASIKPAAPATAAAPPSPGAGTAAAPAAGAAPAPGDAPNPFGNPPPPSAAPEPAAIAAVAKPAEGKLLPAAPASTAPGDVHKLIADLEARWNAVKSYSATVTLESKRSSKEKNMEMSSVQEFSFRRPNLFHEQTTQIKNDGAAWSVGSKSTTVIDGPNLMRYVQNVPGSGQLFADAFSKPRPGGGPPPNKAQIEKMARDHETPHVYHYDLQALTQAGISGEKEFTQAYLPLDPFRLSFCDMNSVVLESENESSWIFGAAASSASMNKGGRERLTIDKKDGIVRMIETFPPPGQEGWSSTETFTNVQVNPTLDDSLFVFNSPPGAVVEDQTQSRIEAKQREKAAAVPGPAATANRPAPAPAKK